MHMKHQNMVDISHFSNINLRYDGWDTFTNLIESSKVLAEEIGIKDAPIEESIRKFEILHSKSPFVLQVVKTEDIDIKEEPFDYFPTEDEFFGGPSPSLLRNESNVVKKEHAELKDTSLSKFFNNISKTKCKQPAQMQRKRTFTCDNCNKTFNNKCLLMRHIMSVHEKIKSHVCSHCKLSFSHSGHLFRHIKSFHEKQKSHQCLICKKKFVEKANLSRHIISVHEKLRPYPCSIANCCKAFTDKRQLSNHFSIAHKNTIPHKCSLCHKAYSSKSSLSRHLREVHQE